MQDEIKIVKYTKDDFNLYYNLVKDDEVMRYVFGRGMTRDEAHKKFDFFIKLNNQNKDLGYFKVFKKGIHIGDCKLVNYREDDSLFEVGYLLKKEFWGKGLGTRVCCLMLGLANEINVKKDIIGIINSQNIASRKLLNKLGFKTYFVGLEDDVEIEKLKLSRLKEYIS